MADKVVKNAAQIAAAQAAQKVAQQKVAQAARDLQAATASAPTRAGAAILGAGKDASSARYTAMAAASGIPNVFGANSKLSVEAQTAPYQKALSDAEAGYAGINVPAPVYDQANTELQSAYDLLFSEFARYGLESLVTPLKDMLTENISPAELGLRLQQTDAYKKRFAANQDRINKGLAALSPADYIGMEDKYQNIMRNYGLPESYYAKDTMGTQEGFQKLLANDVSAAELEDRILTAQSRVINAAPQIKQALTQFYPDITDGDILAYTLDPTKALSDIKRKVTAAEIGGAALAQGLNTDVTRAQDLAAAGVTKAAAQQGYQTIADVVPRGSQLASFYNFEPYTQTTAEQEVFNLAGSAEAARKRRKLVETERATFGGSAGTASSALSRDRSINTQSYREPGAGAY